MTKKNKKWTYQEVLNYYNERFASLNTSIDIINDISKKTKSRYWAFIIYPESADPRWKDILIQYGIKFAVSPLHDKDIKSDHLITDQNNNIIEVEVKKEHYHVLLAFGNTTTYNWVNEICKKAQGIFPVPVSSVKAYYDYLTHKNEKDPDKFHYTEEPETFNGFAIRNFIGECGCERDEILAFVEKYIEEKNIVNYYTLINALKYEGYEVECRVCRQASSYLREYLYQRKKVFCREEQLADNSR